jgi:hypothetical protein
MSTKVKDKIFYFVQGFTDIGLIRSLQEKHDFDVYALIDTNKYMKKFFEKQNLVKFQKSWYYRDNMSKADKPPDLRYLSEFEKKYNINLWLIAYMDRNFYQYNEYYKFSRDEILSILEQDCKLFEQILNEILPDFAIIMVPDYHHNQLLTELCRARGIKVMTWNLSKLGNRSMISQRVSMLDYYDDMIENYSKGDMKDYQELQSFMKSSLALNLEVKKNYRSSALKKLKGAIRYLLIVCNSEYRKYYVNFGRTRKKVLINESSIMFKKKFRELFINKNLSKEIDENDKFVYFPLQFEPEASILMLSPFYTDQLNLILSIAKSLPIDYTLYVKEHPVQVLNGWRNLSFYKTILGMPNVKLLHPSIHNDELLKKCSLVITITGTLGLEAAFYNKPTITFTDIIYSKLPSVYRLKNLEELPQAIRSSLKKQVQLSDLNKYVNCVTDNSFEYDYTTMEIALQNRFFYGGFLFDVELPSNDANTFIDEFKPTFDQLSSEFVRAISQHKKYDNKTAN